MREDRQLEQVIALLGQLQSDQPLHRQLSNYFATHRSMGSRDRRSTRSLVYQFFRLGRSLSSLETHERLAAAAFMCSDSSSPLVEHLLRTHGWDVEAVFNPLPEKLKQLADRYPHFRLQDVLPAVHRISPRIDSEMFLKSLFVQPLVWIRVRESFEAIVATELRDRQWEWGMAKDHPLAWSFPPSVPLQELNSFSKGYFEIQDLSSQKIGAFLHPQPEQRWWDACAASGGKSLLLLDQEPRIELFASDVRDSILGNYKERLSKAGFPGIKTARIDLSTAKPDSSYHCDRILADIPCSGSGTWSRTPEMLVFFKESELQQRFLPLQRQILSKLAECLVSGGKLIMSTCSVFFEENEGNTAFLKSLPGMQFDSDSYIFGASERADTMYVSVFTKG